MRLIKIVAFITSIILCASFVGCNKQGDEQAKKRVIKSPYAYSMKGTTIHHSGCYHVKRITDENLVEYYGDPQDMVANGNKLCSVCFPNSAEDNTTDDNNDENAIPEEEATYVINIGTGKFHEKDCDYAISSSEANKKYTDLSYEELIKEYDACQVCLKNYKGDSTEE